jgi:hypothetical protein
MNIKEDGSRGEDDVWDFIDKLTEGFGEVSYTPEQKKEVERKNKRDSLIYQYLFQYYHNRKISEPADEAQRFVTTLRMWRNIKAISYSHAEDEQAKESLEIVRDITPSVVDERVGELLEQTQQALFHVVNETELKGLKRQEQTWRFLHQITQEGIVLEEKRNNFGTAD